jgi:hypothetical protein
LYTSHIVEWRRARDAGALEALGVRVHLHMSFGVRLDV